MPDLRRRVTLQVGVRVVAWLGIWLLLTVLLGGALLLQSNRSVVLASHDAILRPTLTGYAEVHTGPVLPDVRFPTGRRLGVDVYLGKTEVESTEVLIERYAIIASNPGGQRAKVESALTDMAVSAGLRAGALALVPVGFWFLLGARRRGEIGQRLHSPVLVGVLCLAAVGAVLVWEPWDRPDPTLRDQQAWQRLAEFVGQDVPLPPEVVGLELRGDVTTAQTRRLVESAIDTYDRSLDFYRTAAEDAVTLVLREPEEGDTVVVLISDRHDNVGMDRVARAVADRGGATAVLDAGDDTSTGQPWEAFSLDSVNETFDDSERYAVAGNHDNGPFVASYLDDLGWTMLAGETVEGPGGTTLIGVDDPRSSGLGNWRDETGLSYTEVGTRLADAACASPERVTTVLVHDATLGRETLERGCADLVVGGHLHVSRGPEQYVGPDGEVGYSYTNGTTGGAAYAIAIGSKPRRAADMALLTYRDGRPLGIQGVTLQTDGPFAVGDFVELDYES
ncbi:MAG: metallophosphoesterase family protein [Nocardioides sp.]